MIENQFTRVDHDHLGKMITYASGLQSQIIIWVASRFRDEHRSAIDWLNDVSGSETGFFGVFLEAFQIGDSAYAPHFDIVARSNDWQPQVKRSSSTPRGVPPNETALKLMRFWEDVRAYFESKCSPQELGNTTYDIRHYFKFGICAIYIRVSAEYHATKFRVEFFLAGQKKRPDYSRDWIEHLKVNKDTIAKAAGEALIWDNPEQNVEISVSYISQKGDVDDSASRAKVIARIYDKVHRLELAFRPHIEEFVETHGTL